MGGFPLDFLGYVRLGTRLSSVLVLHLRLEKGENCVFYPVQFFLVFVFSQSNCAACRVKMKDGFFQVFTIALTTLDCPVALGTFHDQGGIDRSKNGRTPENTIASLTIRFPGMMDTQHMGTRFSREHKQG